MMKNIIFLIFSIIALPGFSSGPSAPGSGSRKIGIAPSLGYSYIEIENPNNTKSNYDGIVVQLDVSIPLIKGSTTGVDAHVFYKKSFVDNLSNDGLLSDKASFSGPGLGLNAYYGHLGIGVDYNKVAASHSVSGTFSSTKNYDFKTLTYYIDYAQRQKQFTFGSRFSLESGDISKAETNYSKDVGFVAYTGWIYFIYNTDFALF